MENTKDLVRAERGSRFVCQARGGGRLQLPDPRSPCSSWTPRSQACFSIPRPLNLRGSPPPTGR